MRRRVRRLMGGGRIVLWDSFTDADGTAVVRHASEDGSPWNRNEGLAPGSQDVSFDGTITSGRAHEDVTGACTSVKRPLRCRWNGRVSADIIRTGAAQNEFVGIGLRGNIQSFVQARHSPNGTAAWQIIRLYDRAITTALGSFNQTLTQDQVYRLDFDARGSVFLLWVDGVLRVRADSPSRRRGGPFIRLHNNLTPDTSSNLRLDNWMATR